MNREASEFSTIIGETDLAGRSRMVHSTMEKYTFFSAKQETAFKTGHIIGHKPV